MSERILLFNYSYFLKNGDIPLGQHFYEHFFLSSITGGTYHIVDRKMKIMHYPIQCVSLKKPSSN